MDNYLIDRETLGKFVDELIKKKALPVNNPEELNVLREKSINDLDERIGVAIFSKLSKAQYDELNQLLDNEQSTEETFEAFFNRANINIENTITETVQAFGAEFLGGQNA